MPKEKSTYWGFPIQEDLHEEARETVRRIREGDEASSGKELSRDAASLVIRLTDHGLESYYRRPTEIVPLSSGMRRTADSGISAIMSAINMVIRQFFSKRSEEELRELGEYLEGMLWTHPDREEPHLVFQLDIDMHQRAMTMIERVREDDQTHQYIDEVIDLLCDVVTVSIHHYYHQPTNRVSMGRVSKKTADMGISTAEKGIRSLLNKLLRSLNHQELVELSHHVETLIHEEEAERSGKES